jgi:hypothetical protein
MTPRASNVLAGSAHESRNRRRLNRSHRRGYRAAREAVIESLKATGGR